METAAQSSDQNGLKKPSMMCIAETKNRFTVKPP
jgi:hypothetical protein